MGGEARHTAHVTVALDGQVEPHTLAQERVHVGTQARVDLDAPHLVQCRLQASKHIHVSLLCHSPWEALIGDFLLIGDFCYVLYLEVVVVDEQVEGAHGREGPTQVLDEDLLLNQA